MIETIKDLKHGHHGHGRGSGSYENLTLERTANQILHQMEAKDSEDSLESTRARVLSNARAIYGPCRLLDVISFAPTSSRKIGAAIVEHNPTSRSYIHCTSAKEDSRLAAVEHLLVITEDIMQRLIDAEGITSSGWLPATPAAQHAQTYNASRTEGSVVGSSGMGSRRSSVAPQEIMPAGYINDHHSPHSHHHIQSKAHIPRGSSETSFSHHHATPLPPPIHGIQRTNSEVLQPKPVPVGVNMSQLQGRGQAGGKVNWRLGSED